MSSIIAAPSGTSFIEGLPPGKRADADRVRRFVQEARTASALSQPNVVTIQRMRSRLPAAGVIHRDRKPRIMPAAARSSEGAIVGIALLSLRSAAAMMRKL